MDHHSYGVKRRYLRRTKRQRKKHGAASSIYYWVMGDKIVSMDPASYDEGGGTMVSSGYNWMTYNY